VKITIRYGVFDGGKPCGREVGSLDIPGFPGPEWFRGVGDYDRLQWDERHYVCPKHGALQIHEEDLLHKALNPGRPAVAGSRSSPRPVIMARKPRRG
jgi:hypothetical protein